MGTWGPGPFDSDAAADFLEEVRASPSRVVGRALQAVAKAADGHYLDVDVGGAAWAACELVALAFGYGDAAVTDTAPEGSGKVVPKEEQRLLALAVLSRIAEPATSELAALWHEGSDGAAFDAALNHLRKRLEAASQGARPLPKAKVGDVLCFAAAPPRSELIVAQVVGPGEVALMAGVYESDAAALASVKASPARRVPAPVSRLFRKGRLLGNVPVRKDLKGKKLYAGETGAISDYVLATASAGWGRIVSYEEAREYDVLQPHDVAELRAIAMGGTRDARGRSPDEREAELAARKADEWAARREMTVPGPFGDSRLLEDLLKWMADAELRMIWERAADRGAALHAAVSSLKEALSRVR